MYFRFGNSIPQHTGIFEFKGDHMSLFLGYLELDHESFLLIFAILVAC